LFRVERRPLQNHGGAKFDKKTNRKSLKSIRRGCGFRDVHVGEECGFPGLFTAGGMTTQGNKHLFGNICSASCVCIGDCKLREIKSDEQSGGLSNEN
jgi:hypothetical protein